MGKSGHRGRLLEQAVIVLDLLRSRRRISLAELAYALGSSDRTARRWLVAVRLIVPYRLEHGVVIVDE